MCTRASDGALRLGVGAQVGVPEASDGVSGLGNITNYVPT